MMPRKRWDTGKYPAEMLNFLHAKATDRGQYLSRDRKARLYLVAVCRRFWDELPWVCRALIEITELRADGAFDESRFRALRESWRPLESLARRVERSAEQSVRTAGSGAPWEPDTPQLAECEDELALLGFPKPTGADDHLGDLTTERFALFAKFVYALCWPWMEPGRYLPAEAHSVPLLRDVAGDPYRVPKFKTEWRTDTVSILARQMYDSREFSAMPILADALQDAGCDNDAILNHCREPVEHIRGCWVVDLVLGKE